MIFINIKILITILLSIIPFFFPYFVRNAKKLDLGMKQMTRINNNPPASYGFIKRILYNLHPRRFYEGLRRYKSFRKFLHLMLALTIALIQLIDLHATADVSKHVIANHLHGEEAVAFFQVYGNLITYPVVTLVLFIFDLFLFWYKPTDRLLIQLHSNRRFAWCVGVLAMMFLFYSPRTINLSEIMLLLLVAAYFYPPMSENYTPRSCKPLTSGLNVFSKVA